MSVLCTEKWAAYFNVVTALSDLCHHLCSAGKRGAPIAQVLSADNLQGTPNRAGDTIHLVSGVGDKYDSYPGRPTATSNESVLETVTDGQLWSKYDSFK